MYIYVHYTYEMKMIRIYTFARQINNLKMIYIHTYIEIYMK